MSFKIALGLFLALEALFGALNFIVVYHFRRYGLYSRSTSRIIQVFIWGSLGFFIAALLVFFIVPWDEVAVRLFQSAVSFVGNRQL